MIVLEAPCEKCGSINLPTDVTCDKCGSIQTIADFKGIVIHFGDDDDEGCEDGDCATCEDYIQDEFHFCSIKCLSDYIADPYCDKLSELEERDLSMYVSADEAGSVFYALGRCEW